MNDIARYEFDRLGYTVIPNLLSAEQVASIVPVVDALEEHAVENIDEPPRKRGGWGSDAHRNPEKGYHVRGNRAEGKTIIIEDFWNCDPAFDFLMDLPATMEWINAVVRGRPTINNSEIRIRYKGNQSSAHGGGGRPENHKYRYNADREGIDCMMVRMVYFIHDVTDDQGAFSVVPGSHKSCFPNPYQTNSDTMPGMIGLEVKAGDGIFFTEALTHGGLTNNSDQVRKTLHVGYGPNWMLSQNAVTADEPQYLTEATRARLTEERRDLLRSWPEHPKPR